MDDMKRLIEKYKRELMEYSKASAPKEKLEFPEMLPETDEQPPTPDITPAEPPAASLSAENINEHDEECAETLTPADDSHKCTGADGEKTCSIPGEPAGKQAAPKIIGYVRDGDISDSLPENFSKLFSDMITDNKTLPPDGGETVYDEFSDGNESIEYEDDDRLTSDNTQFSPPQFDSVDSIDNVQKAKESTTDGNDKILNPEELGDNARIEQRQEFVGPQSVSPEVAERLPDQPVSGRDKNEQLTGRHFEDETIQPQNPDDIENKGRGQGSGREPIIYNENNYASYEEFEQANPQRGSIRFRIYTARGALPVKGAVCTVSKKFGGERHVIFTQITDESGLTKKMPLPAPPRSLSQQPESSAMPYALYDAEIKADGYSTVELTNIPVFDGVSSIQRVAMIPAGRNGGE